MGSQVVSAVSLVVAFAAVWVAAWQIRVNTRQTERLNSLPVLFAAFAEFRTPEFRAHVENVMKNVPKGKLDTDFTSLPQDWVGSVLPVCYFYDYLGALIAYRLVDERIIIGTLATQAMQVWEAVEPFVFAERARRKATYSAHASPGFLAYYGHLVKRIVELGGKDAPALIRARAGVLSLDEPLYAPAIPASN